MNNNFTLKKRVKTKFIVYAGSQKQQVKKLTKIPVGTFGVIKHIELEKEFGLVYYLVRLELNGKHYWAKLNESMIERYDD